MQRIVVRVLGAGLVTVEPERGVEVEVWDYTAPPESWTGVDSTGEPARVSRWSIAERNPPVWNQAMRKPADRRTT